MQTGKLASHFGLARRGAVKPGYHADLVVFHQDEIARRPRKKAFDVPDGKGGFTWHWTRDPAPTRLTMVNGMPIFDNRRVTGHSPGEFLRPASA